MKTLNSILANSNVEVTRIGQYDDDVVAITAYSREDGTRTATGYHFGLDFNSMTAEEQASAILARVEESRRPWMW